MPEPSPTQAQQPASVPRDEIAWPPGTPAHLTVPIGYCTCGCGRRLAEAERAERERQQARPPAPAPASDLVW